MVVELNNIKVHIVSDRKYLEWENASADDSRMLAEGIASRDMVISFFGTLFTGKEAEEDSDFWSLLANFVCDLYPEELMDIIQKAYDNYLIFSGMIRYEDFQKALADGKEKCLERL